jgi:hypothetical protein
MDVEGLFGIVVIIYLIASVVGAVVKRMQQGPIIEDPVFPTRPQPQGQPQSPRPIETVSMPSIPAETLQPAVEEGQMVEVLEVADGDESYFGTAAPESQAGNLVEDLEPKALKSWSFLEGEWDEEVDDHDHGHRAWQESGQMPARAESPTWRATAPQWRRAIVLAEILDKPRALKPFRPVGIE